VDETDPAGRGEVTDQILGAEQDERRRIALFLHDGPVQSLSGIALMLDAVGDFLSRGSTEQAREILDKALWETSGHWEWYRENMFAAQSAGDGALDQAILSALSNFLRFGIAPAIAQRDP